MAFIDSLAEEMTENRLRERGSDRQQRTPDLIRHPVCNFHWEITLKVMQVHTN